MTGKEMFEARFGKLGTEPVDILSKMMESGDSELSHRLRDIGQALDEMTPEAAQFEEMGWRMSGTERA